MERFCLPPNHITKMTNNISDNAKKFYKWKAGQINIQTCSDDHKIHMTLQECSNANLDIICLQECRLLNTGSINHLGYNFYWSGMSRYKRYGVGIAIRNSNDIITNSVVYFSARLMAADVVVKGCKIRVVCAYAPTLDKPLSSKESFYRDLREICKIEDHHRKLFIMGDFNAEPQISRSHSKFDGRKPQTDNGANYSNENNQLFLQYCQRLELSILNTWFDHPIHHRETWHHPNGLVKKVYDYSLSDRWLRQYVTDVRVRNSYFSSDHRLVVTKLVTPANKAARRFIRKKMPRKPNLENLKNDHVNIKFRRKIEEHLEQNPLPESIDEMHTHIIQTLDKGRQLIPKITKKKLKIPWNTNSELKELHESRMTLRRKPMNDANKERLKKLNKTIKKKVCEIQNGELKAKGLQINEAKQHRKIAKMWKEAKKHDSSTFAKTSAIQCPGISSHFKKHFNPDHSNLGIPAELCNTPDFIRILQSSNLEIVENSPSQEEIQTAINRLNNGKSSLDIESEIVKLASSIQDIMNNLKTYFDYIWKEKEIPTQWTISQISPIWKKKGSAMDPSKYRGISISSVFCKIAMNIILKRLESFYESQLKRTQFGFRNGVGCNDGIYMLKQIQEISQISQRKLYLCFIDLTAAFDHVNRNLLFMSIKKRLPPNQTSTNLKIIENLYNQTRSYLQGDDPDQNSFETTSGVRQGGMEGPPLYNLFSDYVLRTYEDRKNTAGITGLGITYSIPNEATNRQQRDKAPTVGICDDDDCGYADDLVLICWSKKDLQLCLNILLEVFDEYGLNINHSKTETMIMNWQTSDGEYPDTIISLNNKNITNSTCFKYLGVWLNHNCLHIGNEELQHRINSAHTAFAENKKLLTNKNIDLSTRVMFLNSLVRSRLTYGCHAWRPSLHEINKLETTYRFFLRCMIYNGHKRVNPPPREGSHSTSSDESGPSDDEETQQHDWRYVINNETLYQMTRTKTISQFHHQQQEQFIAHIIRRENDNIGKILTFHTTKRSKRGRKILSILDRAVLNSGRSYSEFVKLCFNRKNRR